MAQAARLGDAISGTTSGEHSGHTEPCSASAISGSINGGCSADVFINGKSAATVGSTTLEKDSCCGSAYGNIASGSGSVFINGKAAARNGDALNAHSGTALIVSGSNDVLIGE